MSEMIVSTMNDLPGYRVDEVIGEVTGLTVRSRNVGHADRRRLQVARGRRAEGPHQAAAGEPRRSARPTGRGGRGGRRATRCSAMRFDSDEVGNGYQELVAYGTAVKVSPA